MNAKVHDASVALRDELDKPEPPAKPDLSLVPPIDDEMARWLSDEGLDVVLEPEASRVETDIWIDVRLAAIARIQAEIAHNIEVRDRRLSMIRNHFDGLIESLKRRALWLHDFLVQMTRAYPFPRGSKTRELPSGTIKKVWQPEKLDVWDESAAMNWAKTNLPEAIKLSESLLKTPLSEYYKRTGELPPGCSTSGGFDKPYVTAKERS